MLARKAKAKAKGPYVPSSSRDPKSEDEGNEHPLGQEEEMVEPPSTHRRKRSSEEALDYNPQAADEINYPSDIFASVNDIRQAMFGNIEDHAQGATSEKFMENGRLERGIINSSILTKSMSQSKKLTDCRAGQHMDGVSKLKHYFQHFGYCNNSKLTDDFDDDLESVIKTYTSSTST
ncbi:hypothetical protein RHSIM_Rhsim03G0134100 [Rhododendron simsii]|uniref:Uncharacterized protein n=1 Tax=Rhododendron simsii TaxID=118357 RepID=A0A834H8D7_RHOSS|nr:hypothetical protein RHSIM_Rhsim03G0134100 [Rhododendron simsii]